MPLKTLFPFYRWMKKIVFGLILFGAVVLLLGCTQPPANNPTNPNNANPDAAGLKECGTDFDCFSQTALNDCGKAGVTNTSAINGFFGSSLVTTLRYETRGKENGQCLFYQKWTSISVTFPADSNMPVDQQSQMTAALKLAEGKDVLCRLEQEQFNDYLEKLSGYVKTGSGSFSTDDLPLDQCTGSWLDLNE